MKPLYYPISPIAINQPFGANELYYESKFGQKGHPGIDFAASHGLPVYAAHDGQAIYIKDAHGGEGIWLFGGDYITIYWHLIGDTDTNFPPPILFNNNGVRTPVTRGQLIGYADNTGAPFESSGDHLHFGLMLAANDVPLDTDNGTQGCIDPQPYFNGQFADPTQEIVSEVQKVASAVNNIQPDSPTVLQQENLVVKVVDLIEQEIKEL